MTEFVLDNLTIRPLFTKKDVFKWKNMYKLSTGGEIGIHGIKSIFSYSRVFCPDISKRNDPSMDQVGPISIK